ncbi:MAG: GNAT family N-acetyltransferase [Pacificimonas sp.]
MSDDDFTVRQAGERDGAALSLVARTTFHETFAGILTGKDIVQHCAENYAPDSFSKGTAWLAEEDRGAPVGYAFTTEPDLPEIETRSGDVEVKKIYVLSRWHGTGVGSALMAVAADKARRDGASRLLLGVYARNGRAIRFYQKSGFSIAGSRRFLVGDTYYDDVIMARDLQETEI